ncbi:MAG: hypothetical protein LBO09_02570 [Candidatus Peribacteria bacterium]|jgi:hypothetical protein|nr:hypothetical protein [Candidatus Peribacteria bacterium]
MINSLSNNYSYKEGEETTNYSSDLLQEIKHPSLDLKLGRKCPLQSQDRGEITNLFKENHGKKAIDLIGTCEPSFPDWKNEDVYEIIDYGGNVHIAKVDPSRQWMSE